MEFRVLGPLEVWLAGRRLDLGGPGRRRLLAVLLVEANRVVSVDRLVNVLWGGGPPATAHSQVQGHISALRRLFADHAADQGSRELIVTRPPGYLIRVAPGQLDLEVFEQRVAQAERALAEQRLAEAGELLREALASWRGAAFEGVGGGVAEAEAVRLGERRLTVLEKRIELDLRAGRHGDLVPELTWLVAEHPLRERLRAQLMTALYRAGRQADALAVYREGRRHLTEELGLEPGSELRRLEQAILSADPTVESVLPVGTDAAGPVVPAQLPADTRDFTGRVEQVEWLGDLLSGGAGRTVVIAGRAGVGKTTLAVHAGHRLRPHFPDGQLYVNLRGADARPVSPGELLGRLLGALGATGAAIPETQDERAAMYRSRLADRRMLVVLDNAVDTAQVRPLLPGGAGCAVLVTSRTRLVGLEASRLVELDVLTPELAVELFGRVAGAERVAAEPQAADRIVQLCGGLPLAVRIAAAKLVGRRHWSLDRLAERLVDQRRRLDELACDDLSVRTSLEVSYLDLDQTTQRAFRLLALLDASDVAAWTVAALLDIEVDAADEIVERLVETQLLDIAYEDGTGQLRYRFHDLTRVYARERAHTEETAEDRAAALVRALGGWLAFAEDADWRLSPPLTTLHGDAPRWRPAVEVADVLLADPAAWFEAERLAMVAAVEQADQLGLDELAWDLTGSATCFLETRGYLEDWQRMLLVATAATHRTGNRRGYAAVLVGLGEVCPYRGTWSQTVAHLEQALEVFTELADRQGQARALAGLVTPHGLDHLDASASYSAQAEALCRELGDFRTLAFVHHEHGILDLAQGRFGPARDRVTQALTIYRELGCPQGQARALASLGYIHLRQDRLDDAEECLNQARALYGSVFSAFHTMRVLRGLAEIYLRCGQYRQAQARLDECLDGLRQHGDRLGEAAALRTLGELHHAEGNLDAAMCCLGRSARMFDAAGNGYFKAMALRSLGVVQQAAGDSDTARASWDEAFALFEQYGAEADTEQLTQQLERLSRG